MNRNNVLLFLYAYSAIVFFEDVDLTIIPKIFAGLLIVEYALSILSSQTGSAKSKWSAGIFCLLFLSLYALVSFSFSTYDLQGESVVNIVMILVLSFILNRTIDTIKAFDLIITGVALGLTTGFIMNIISPPIDEYGRVARFTGTLGNPNFFALIINFTIVFLLQRYKFYSKTARSLILGFIIFSFYQVMMSGSKMGLLMYLINVLYLIFYIRVIKSTTGLILISLVIVSLSGYFITNFLTDNSQSFARIQYLQDIFSGKDSYSDSDILRYNLMLKGWDMWTEHPFLGWGYGAFLYIGGFNLYSHNNMMELLANTGIIGFILFHAALIQLIVVSTKTNIHRTNNIIWTLYFFLIVIVSSFGIVLLAEKLYWLFYFALAGFMRIHTVKREIPPIAQNQLN